MPSELRPPPMMVPQTDKRLIARPELFDSIVDALCRTGRPEVSLATSLQGTGGFGKTTLAEMVCSDAGLRSSFPGGILWTVLGERGSEEHLTARIGELYRVLTDETLTAVEPRAAGRALAAAIGAERRLLVVDDVWTAGQLAPFRLNPESCSLLITTRNTAVVGPATSTIRVEAMDAKQAKALLLAGLPDADDALTSELVATTGCWPLLLALVNGYLSMLVLRNQNAIEHALIDATARLRSAGPAAFDLTRAEDRHDAVERTMRASLDFLRDTGRPGDFDRYLKLAVFDDRSAIPLASLEHWWADSKDAPMPADEVSRLCADLEGVALIVRYELSPAQIRLHEVVLRYLQLYIGPAHLARLRNEWLDIEPPVCYDTED